MLSSNISEIVEITSSNDYLVQKYIEEPLLIHKKKFDVRQFVLVTSLDPLVIFLNTDCYLRFSSKNYSLTNITDLYVHLTNHQIQKDSPEFDTSGIKDNQWSLSTFKEYLKTELAKPDDFWEEHIYPQIKKIVIASLKAWPKSGHRNNSFELLGYDILIDKNFNLWLLEINTNPGLHLLTDVVNKHHPQAIKGLFKVVLDNKESWSNKNSNDQNVDYGVWSLIYHEGRLEV